MPITSKEVEKIADLAHLEFEPEALDRFIEQFEEILEYFRHLEKIPTDDIPPMYHALRQEIAETPLREDEPGGSFSPEVAVSEAPDAVDGQFRVPRVIE